MQSRTFVFTGWFTILECTPDGYLTVFVAADVATRYASIVSDWLRTVRVHTQSQYPVVLAIFPMTSLTCESRSAASRGSAEPLGFSILPRSKVVISAALLPSPSAT